MNCSCVVFISTVTLSIKERWPSVFVTCSVCSFLPDGSNYSFCLPCRLPPHDHLAVSSLMEKFHTALGAVSKRVGWGGGGGCEITLEIMTRSCLAINLIEFILRPSSSLHNLRLPVATCGFGSPAILCTLFHAMTKLEDDSLCEIASVLPKQSPQGQGERTGGGGCML